MSANCIFERLSELIINNQNEELASQLRDVISSSQFSVDDVDETGRTLLFVAAQSGNAFATRVLLSHDANIEARNDTGYTPLHIAAEDGKAETLQLLLQRNANVNNVENGWGSTPIICAAFWGSELCARLLVEAGCDVTKKAAFDYSALGVASLKGFVSIVECLLQSKRCDIEVRSSNGGTPIFLAAGAFLFDRVTLLLHHGARRRQMQ